MAPPTFVHVMCLIFVGQSTLTMHGTHVHISVGRIMLLLLSSAAIALLLTDPELDWSSMGSLLGSNASHVIRFIYKQIMDSQETVYRAMDWLTKVCHSTYQHYHSDHHDTVMTGGG